jgi:hypothetical protein
MRTLDEQRPVLGEQEFPPNSPRLKCFSVVRSGQGIHLSLLPQLMPWTEPLMFKSHRNPRWGCFARVSLNALLASSFFKFRGDVLFDTRSRLSDLAGSAPPFVPTGLICHVLRIHTTKPREQCLALGFYSPSQNDRRVLEEKK